ncbi:MAG TPA: PEP-CTERM sorting domain-containing protein, partial [Pirellulales bacterium]
ATFNTGSIVMINIDGSNFVNGETYTLMHAAGGAVIDPGVTFETNRFFVKAAIEDTGTDIDVKLTEDFVPRRHATKNQVQLGTYLNNNISNPNPDFQKLLAALASIPSNAPNAQDAVDGNDFAAINTLVATGNDFAATNTSVGVGNALAAVPEPSSIVLLALGLAASWKVFAGKSKRR